ncbi:MAG: hypothetical protein RSH26_08770 [Clostridia bacterium]
MQEQQFWHSEGEKKEKPQSTFMQCVAALGNVSFCSFVSKALQMFVVKVRSLSHPTESGKSPKHRTKQGDT